jgi:hypothetical protein
MRSGRCIRHQRVEKMSKLSFHQTEELMRIFNSGQPVSGVFPKMSPPTRNALIVLGYIDYNAVTKVVTMTREGVLVCSAIYATR